MRYYINKAGWDYVIRNETGEILGLIRPRTNGFGWKLMLGDSQIVLKGKLSLWSLLYSFHAELEGKNLTIRRKSFFDSTYLVKWGAVLYYVYEHKQQLNSIFLEYNQVGYTAVEGNSITLVRNGNENLKLMLLIVGATNCYWSSSNEINLGRIIKETEAFNHAWQPS